MYNTPMFEVEQKHRRGRKTFIFLFVQYGWWMTLIGVGLLYLSYAIYFGNLYDSASEFLAQHPTWYIDTPMLAEWLLLLGIAFVFVAYLRASVIYRHYHFMLGQYAFHLHRGLFFIRETTIPYTQISNVHIARPYHYRLFGIAQLDIVTAADKSMEIAENRTKKFLIPIIDVSVARRLSNQLLESASRSRRKEFMNPINSEDEGEFEEDNESEEEQDSFQRSI